MMRREGGRVVIEISEDEYERLMIILGYALYHEPLPWGWVALANAINEGNPHWTPYEVPHAE